MSMVNAVSWSNTFLGPYHNAIKSVKSCSPSDLSDVLLLGKNLKELLMAPETSCPSRTKLKKKNNLRKMASSKQVGAEDVMEKDVFWRHVSAAARLSCLHRYSRHRVLVAAVDYIYYQHWSHNVPFKHYHPLLFYTHTLTLHFTLYYNFHWCFTVWLDSYSWHS